MCSFIILLVTSHIVSDAEWVWFDKGPLSDPVLMKIYAQLEFKHFYLYKTFRAFAIHMTQQYFCFVVSALSDQYKVAITAK